MTILLDAHAEAHPERPALDDEFGSTTWSELRTRVAHLSNAFVDRGVGPGETIAMMMGLLGWMDPAVMLLPRGILGITRTGPPALN